MAQKVKSEVQHSDNVTEDLRDPKSTRGSTTLISKLCEEQY